MHAYDVPKVEHIHRSEYQTYTPGLYMHAYDVPKVDTYSYK
jgi:hypothetical protein